MALYIQMVDEGDLVTYGFSLSTEDALKILKVQYEVDTLLPSMEGTVHLSDDNILVVNYKNGSSGYGSVFTDYKKVCEQIKSQL